jgi:hypothetical protein
MEDAPEPEIRRLPENLSEPCELDEGEESLLEAEPELELDVDPILQDDLNESGPEWEAKIRAIKVRKAKVPTAEAQMARIRKCRPLKPKRMNHPRKR